MLAVYRKFAVLYINVHVHVQQVWYKYELSTNQKLPRGPPLEKKKFFFCGIHGSDNLPETATWQFYSTTIS
jgi:hypothetical protein